MQKARRGVKRYDTSAYSEIRSLQAVQTGMRTDSRKSKPTAWVIPNDDCQQTVLSRAFLVAREARKSQKRPFPPHDIPELECITTFIPICSPHHHPYLEIDGDENVRDTVNHPSLELEDLLTSRTAVYTHDLPRSPYLVHFDLPNRYEEVSSSGIDSSVWHSTLSSVGDWRVISLIGEGSQGEVYRCESLTHNFEFATKCIRRELDSPTFLASKCHADTVEIGILSSLEHKNIVKLFGGEIVTNRLLIFMEYCPGGSLSDYIRARGRLSEIESHRIIKQVLEAIKYLHFRRNSPVIHRDIKSSNILIASGSSDGGPIVKLTDFGSSTDCKRDQVGSQAGRLRLLSPTAVETIPSTSPFLTVESMELRNVLSVSVKGTCNWMAPEVLRGMPYSTGCDIWSTGCTTVEMLTGALPWRKFDNTLAGMFTILTSGETPLDYIDPGLMKSLSPTCINFLKHTFERDPEIRWNCKQLLKHTWLRPTLEMIPYTPVNSVWDIPADM